MVQAVINISDRTNRVLNIVKAKYGLRTKSEAIDMMASEYEDDILEPELRPEFIKKAQRIMKQKAIHIGTMEDFEEEFK